MSKTINDYTAAVSVNATTDFLLIEQSSTYKKISQQVLLNITGSPVGTSDTQNLTNKTLNNTNAITVLDGSFTLQHTGGTTKQAVFSLTSITAGQTRTLTIPDASLTIVGTATTQTLTNKTLTSPAITGGTIDNATITVDSIAGHTTPTTVTVANLQIANGVLNTNNSVVTANITAGISLPDRMFNPYKFNVYLAGAQNVGTADTKVNFDTKNFDTGSNFDVVTNHRFVAPIAGFYQFNANILTTTAGTGTTVGISLYKNNAVIVGPINQPNASGANPAMPVSALLQLSATDYVEVFVGTAAAAKALDVGTAARNTFSGFLVSAT